MSPAPTRVASGATCARAGSAAGPATTSRLTARATAAAAHANTTHTAYLTAWLRMSTDFMASHSSSSPLNSATVLLLHLRAGLLSPAVLHNAPTLASNGEFGMNLVPLEHYSRRTSENSVPANFGEHLFHALC